MYRTWIEIDTEALQHNLKVLQGFLNSETKILATVKANAYGHGLKEISKIIFEAGVNSFGVDTLDDALKLREAFPSAQVVVLGYILKEDLPKAINAGLEFVVYNLETIEALKSISSEHQAKVHLKIETGTARQGILLKNLAQILDLLKSTDKIKLVGLSTHFATAEETGENNFFVQQLETFKQAEHQIKEAGFSPEHIHCACSAAIFLHPEAQGTLVRAGIAMYGIWPSEEIKKVMSGTVLKPVLSWKTRIAQIKEFPIGTSIGYGQTEVLSKPGRVAVLPVGYFDGYDRRLSSVGEVLVGGKPCKVLGRICMNMMMIDVSEVPGAKIEDEVILIGPNGENSVTADDLSGKMNTIAYEVLARLRADLPRLVK